MQEHHHCLDRWWLCKKEKKKINRFLRWLIVRTDVKCYNQPVSCVHNFFLEFICLGVVSHCSRFGSLNGCLMYTSRNISRLPWILGVYIYCYCIPICNSFCIYLVVITLNYLQPLAKEGEKGKKKSFKVILTLLWNHKVVLFTWCSDFWCLDYWHDGQDHSCQFGNPYFIHGRWCSGIYKCLFLSILKFWNFEMFQILLKEHRTPEFPERR